MSSMPNKLTDGDLRSIGDVKSAIIGVTNQKTFDELFAGLFDSERIITMRSADAIEKITIAHPAYLTPHKIELLELLQSAKNIELKWHLAQLMPRLKLSEKETGLVWNILTHWANDKKESRIVRVNSLQALFDIQKEHPKLKKDLTDTISTLERENILSITARIKKLKRFKTDSPHKKTRATA
jgi:hypothetical protein